MPTECKCVCFLINTWKRKRKEEENNHKGTAGLISFWNNWQSLNGDYILDTHSLFMLNFLSTIIVLCCVGEYLCSLAMPTEVFRDERSESASSSQMVEWEICIYRDKAKRSKMLKSVNLRGIANRDFKYYSWNSLLNL